MKKAGPNLAARVLNAGLLLTTLVLGGFGLRGAIQSANVRADLDIVTAEAQSLYDGMQKYYERHEHYPTSYSDRSFDLETLDPLASRGYYKGYLTTKIVGNAVDAYESPDDQGQNQEFWIEMTLARDPSIRVLIVRSDDAPMGGGVWLDGVYVLKRGSLGRV